MGFITARIIAALMLFLALDRFPYGYYTLLRLVVCSTTAYGSYLAAIELNKPRWAWAFGIVAVLFNPLIPIYLDRGTWAIVDVAVALMLLGSLFFVKGKRLKGAQ